MSNETKPADGLEPLPPSAKLVHKALEYEGPLTQPELADETLLPIRTVRHALDRLHESDVIESEFIPGDARRKRYRILEGDTCQTGI